jgi:hypothetical protein
MNKQYLTGKVFGRLTVVKPATGTQWVCRCSCGNTKVTRAFYLINGRVKSCGCLNRLNKRLYWKGLRPPERIEDAEVDW